MKMSQIYIINVFRIQEDFCHNHPIKRMYKEMHAKFIMGDAPYFLMQCTQIIFLWAFCCVLNTR